MLTIRKAQVDVFRTLALGRFETQMTDYLKQEFPARFPVATGASLETPHIETLVREGVARAARYRITAQKDVARFILLMVLIGEDFDSLESMKWTARFLQDPALPGGAKMDIIIQEITSGEHTGILSEHETSCFLRRG